MRIHYPRGFREEMILKFESLSPKMRYIDFAKENDITLETLKTWIYDSRKKSRAGIVEIKTTTVEKNEEEKIPVHITLNTGTSIHVVLNQSQLMELIWKTP